MHKIPEVITKPFSKVIRSRIALVAALFLFAVPVKCQVYVGGELTADVTYSPGNNPYIVTQDLIVTENVTLTILPGVEMLFEYGTGIISYGKLVAKGKPDQEISFLPRNPSAFSSQWNGIVFNNAKSVLSPDSAYLSGSILADAVLSNCSYSITLNRFTSLLVENTRLELCSFGIYIMESANNIIRNCSFNTCDYGIFIANGFQNPGNKIYGNTISGCSDVAIFINSKATQSNHNFITANQIKYCNIGLHIGNFTNNGPGFNLIAGNSFIGNKDAVKLFQKSNTISNNYFVANRSGILCWQSNGNTITQNLFSRNVLNAITLAAGSSFNNITYNSMNFNSGGVWIKPDSSRNSLYNSFLYNTVYHNSDFSFQVLNTPQGPVQFNNIGYNGANQSFINLSDSVVHAEYNYWGTTSDPGIDNIVYDVHDLPSLGEVLYKPSLGHILTTAPVPPPCHVIKQMVGNDVVVSWNVDSVADLRGYNVYYGANDGIVYAHKILNIQGTKINLGNIPIGDAIALTAFDAQANGVNDQTEGFESDFAFAILTPYAGPDTAICFNSNYTVGDATAVNYSYITWSSSGDGVFSDEHILNPVYFPGPVDYFNRQVYIYLDAQSGETVFEDAALITFHDAPLVFSGNDTTITMDETFWLGNATASGFDHLKWTTSGDGTFNSDTLRNPVYTPGPADLNIASVILTLTGHSACGSDVDQLSLDFVPGYSIQGRIHAGDMLASNSSLNLFRDLEGEVKPVRSGLVADNGHFDIKSLFAGTYYLYAVPDKTAFPGFLPTYYFNDIRWQNAYRMELNANTYDVDIDLARSTVQLPEGEGSILGYCASLPGSSGKCGDVTVLLYDRKMKNILNWVLVHNGSDFHFEKLPFGEYILSGEKTGIPAFRSVVIVLSQSSPKVENVELVCTPAGDKFSVPGTLNPDMNPGGIGLYPNPVRDRLYISGLKDNESYSASLFNIQGHVQDFQLDSNGPDANSLLLGMVPPGLYFIEIYLGRDCLVRQKLIKY